MQTIQENKYLKFINLSELTNWSVQYLKWITFSYNENFKLVSIWDFLTRNKTWINIENWKEYKRVTIKMNNNWVFLRDTEKGENIWTKKQFLVEWWEFIMSKIDARNWAFWIVPKNLKWAIVTNDFPSFYINQKLLNIDFFVLLASTKEFIYFAQHCSSWTTWRKRIDMNLFLNVKIPLPPLSEQNKIVENYKNNFEKAKKAEKRVFEAEKEIESYLMEELGIEVEEKEGKKKGLQFVGFKDLDIWNIWNRQVLIKSKNMIL